ncbi:allophanate hydrolase [Methyloterricola oryzae]|uniref:allophanate hydrolase n=1 Tax=Methyloterricola oryzae TaxID=1495050 RepID=UPI0005EB199A|nr:allophanate hydrolase [Methyloterricola oryzae]
MMPSVLNITALHDTYRQGSLTPSGLVNEVLQRIGAAHRPEIWINLRPRAELEEQARQLAALLQREGEAVFQRYPLFGIPFSVKDNIEVTGLPNSVGCPVFAYTPKETASAVQRLEAAGALLIGKTNLDQFATGLTGTRSPYGAVPNPFAPGSITGGSSSGSAASVALGQVAFSLGTDTAGSGRIPAAFCNLVGIKPTPGLVSNRGVFPACESLDCVSVFALDVADGWRVLSQIAGHDPSQAYSRSIEALGPLCREVSLGLPAPLEFLGDHLAETAFRSTLEAIQSRKGLHIQPVDFALFRQTAALLYEGPWLAERRASLGDFHLTHPEALDPAVRAVLSRRGEPSAEETFEGLHRLEQFRQACRSLFETIDILLVPTAPTHPTLAAIAEAPLERNTELGLYTNFVNLLGLCALALPGHFRADGLPAGITLIGPAGADHRLAEFARTLEPLTHRRLGISKHAPRIDSEPLAPLPSGERSVRLAVVGAHLEGEPLNWQLRERGGRLVQQTRTTPRYGLFALRGTVPPKPGLIRLDGPGSAIAVEVWELPIRRYGEFVAEVPPPLAIGTLELEGGEQVQGFLCEAWALQGAEDIRAYGGWRAYRQAGRSAT